METEINDHDLDGDHELDVEHELDGEHELEDLAEFIYLKFV